MAELKLRLNLDKEEVELVVDGQVAFASGSEVFKNWVEAYNAKHKVEEVISGDNLVEPPVALTVNNIEVVTPPQEEPPTEVDNQ